MVRAKKPDPLEKLGKELAADHTTAKNTAQVADTVSAGAIEGAGAVAAAGGNADQTAAGAIGGAAAATAEVLADAPNEDPPADEQDGIDEAFQNRMDRLVRIVEDADFDGQTAVGDIRDCLLELFKTRDKPWHLLDANMRRDLDQHLTKVAQLVVRRVVLVVAEEDSLSIQATMLGKFAVNGDSLELKLKVDHADDDVILATHKLAGHQVVVISATDKRFGSARRPNDPGETQVTMAFADDTPTEMKHAKVVQPADDKDLAGETENSEATGEAEQEDLEAEASDPDAADWAVYDDEGEVWLAAASEDDPWTDNPDKAMRFTLQAAKDECESHGEGMIVQRHALATDESDEG